MVKKWDKYRNSERMFRRVYKGIPLQLRGQVWSLLLDVEKVKMENAGKYEMKFTQLTVSPSLCHREDEIHTAHCVTVEMKVTQLTVSPCSSDFIMIRFYRLCTGFEMRQGSEQKK
ncbi:hypothetical protein JZ751_020259 [Albula glossodonta]|uniref:Rab-GAP TBC domain-containing protein n=1 Tax=Albula glossodonta TaxID=121402 RepID=A0A8T2MYF9_9TELE|nr:hypothetical protein JZ751_020259 [Albula glossodonta]